MPKDLDVLPPAHRLRRSGDFRAVIGRGRRTAAGSVVIHLLPAPAERTQVTRAGLVVSRAVGGSVVRHRVARRLRHQLRVMLPDLPPGSSVVVRARPSAAVASSRVLGADLRAALARLLR